MMHNPVLRLLPIFAVILLCGCTTTLPTFTEGVRQSIQADGFQALVLHVATPMEFRSLRALDTSLEEGPFKKDPHRYLKLDVSDPGTIVGGGNGWITVDFGRGIFLTFTALGIDNVYTTRGWGTITIEGERYDILVGVLSGKDVDLHYDQAR